MVHSGVVYTELENLEAAYHSFLNAIEFSDIEKRRWTVYYALALNRFATVRFEKINAGNNYKDVLQEVVQHSTQAINLDENNPNLYDLRGVAHRYLAEYSSNLVFKNNHYKYAREDNQTAVIKSRRALVGNYSIPGMLNPDDNLMKSERPPGFHSGTSQGRSTSRPSVKEKTDHDPARIPGLDQLTRHLLSRTCQMVNQMPANRLFFKMQSGC